MTAAVQEVAGMPDMKVSVRQVWKSTVTLKCHVTRRLMSMCRISIATIASTDRRRFILAGFAKNRRVIVTGYHRTGKSTHIEQVAARLNWPCVRVNLDSHISRIDLVGKDAIVLHEGKQVTEFREGMLPWVDPAKGRSPSVRRV